MTEDISFSNFYFRLFSSSFVLCQVFNGRLHIQASLTWASVLHRVLWYIQSTAMYLGSFQQSGMAE